MTGENPKPYLSEGGIAAEDDSIVTRYRADACWNACCHNFKNCTHRVLPCANIIEICFKFRNHAGIW